tara:strand:- start:1118 stop:1606 length:489 start_codon:yes stop_codon:yes gene_type:complete
MINSLVLQTYSPIIVPLSFIYGINFVEKELVYGGFPSIGFFAIMMSLLIYYDRVEDKKKEYLASGLVAFFLSYLLLSYTKKVIFSALCLLVSLFLIGYGISDMGFYSYKNQYIYLSLFMIFVSLVFLIPYEREYLNAYSISMLMLAFAITILVFMSVKTPIA